LIGIVGLVASSLAHAGAWGDVIFNASAVCLIVAPLIFFAGTEKSQSNFSQWADRRKYMSALGH
jgi:hypothetical protein